VGDSSALAVRLSQTKTGEIADRRGGSRREPEGKKKKSSTRLTGGKTKWPNPTPLIISRSKEKYKNRDEIHGSNSKRRLEKGKTMTVHRSKPRKGHQGTNMKKKRGAGASKNRELKKDKTDRAWGSGGQGRRGWAGKIPPADSDQKTMGLDLRREREGGRVGHPLWGH